MKAEEYVHKITDLYDNSGDEAAAIKLLKQYANQRVIEELEELLRRAEGSGRNITNVELSLVIKELKQE
jgi:hypothetical protein|tara:strand:- start:259 stop:465 length:207 start_codon:yes stop_codon:yes gene_type:complete